MRYNCIIKWITIRIVFICQDEIELQKRMEGVNSSYLEAISYIYNVNLEGEADILCIMK
jgi:hypothetical protein